MKILIVDDSKSVHMFTSYCLSKIGPLDLVHVYDGKQALAVYDESYDLILMDWEMPVQNGPDTLKAMRLKGITTPVVIMTTRSTVNDINFMLDLGADDYMMKPFTADIIEEKIKPFLKGVQNDAA